MPQFKTGWVALTTEIYYELAGHIVKETGPGTVNTAFILAIYASPQTPLLQYDFQFDLNLACLQGCQGSCHTL